jgi:GNAT superfamily N-acetyltransferase
MTTSDVFKLTHDILDECIPLLKQAINCKGMHIHKVSDLTELVDGNYTIAYINDEPVALYSVIEWDSYFVKNRVLVNMCDHFDVFEIGSFFIRPDFRGIGLLNDLVYEAIAEAHSRNNQPAIVCGLRTEVSSHTSIHKESIPSLRVLISHGFNFVGLDPADMGLRFARLSSEHERKFEDIIHGK